MSYIAKRNGYTLVTGSDAGQVVRCCAPNLSSAERQSYSQALESGGSVQIPDPTTGNMIFVSKIQKSQQTQQTNQAPVTKEEAMSQILFLAKAIFVFLGLIIFLKVVN